MENAELNPIEQIDGKSVFKAPLPKITAPVGGAVIDVESRATNNAIIAVLEKLGFIKNN